MTLLSSLNLERGMLPSGAFCANRPCGSNGRRFVTPVFLPRSAARIAAVPRRDDLQKILIIGSGPIVIGQACEFDYSGTQACKSLREEGYEVVLSTRTRPRS